MSMAGVEGSTMEIEFDIYVKVYFIMGKTIHVY